MSSRFAVVRDEPGLARNGQAEATITPAATGARHLAPGTWRGPLCSRSSRRVSIRSTRSASRSICARFHHEIEADIGQGPPVLSDRRTGQKHRDDPIGVGTRIAASPRAATKDTQPARRRSGFASVKTGVRGPAKRKGAPAAGRRQAGTGSTARPAPRAAMTHPRPSRRNGIDYLVISTS